MGLAPDAVGKATAWEEMCRVHAAIGSGRWPRPEAQALIDSILASAETGDMSLVDEAARAWARTCTSVSNLVRQMAVLGEVVGADGLGAVVGIRERLVHAVDRATTSATAAALANLENAALTDALTGAGNRRSLEMAAAAALASATRGEYVVSVVVIDLDGLKAINDSEGHAAGDRAIAGVTMSLRNALRQSDQLFRIGGDEFVALLPMAPMDTVAELMSRARQQGAPAFSWGVASAPEDGTGLDDLLAKADERLYARRRHTRGTEHRAKLTGNPISSTATTRAKTGAEHRRLSGTKIATGILCAAAVCVLAYLVGSRPSSAGSPTQPTTHTSIADNANGEVPGTTTGSSATGSSAASPATKTPADAGGPGSPGVTSLSATSTTTARGAAAGADPAAVTENGVTTTSTTTSTTTTAPPAGVLTTLPYVKPPITTVP